MTTERWGICGEDWTQIRLAPPDASRDRAYGWARSFTEPTHSRKATRAEHIDVYVDHGTGAGWEFVERVTGEPS